MGSTPTSQARIEANRRNALNSTGPKTDEGKARSRRNSLVHGLAGNGVVRPEEGAQVAEQRTEEWAEMLRPQNAFEDNLVRLAAAESLRIDRCHAEELFARSQRAQLAEVCWDDVRKAETEHLARSFGRRPADTAAKLAATAPGCDWLIARWRLLGRVLETAGTWSFEHLNLALDLLGVAHELRDQPTAIDAPEGADQFEHLRLLIAAEVDRLTDRKRQVLDELEEDHREAAMLGLESTDAPRLALIRRYQAAAFRRMKWALDLLDKGRTAAQPAETTESAPAEPAEPPQAEQTQPAHLVRAYAPAPRPNPTPETAPNPSVETEPPLETDADRTEKARRRRAAMLQMQVC